MQGILLVRICRSLNGEGGLCRKGFLVTWCCSSLELKAWLKLHQHFDYVFDLVHQDRAFW